MESPYQIIKRICEQRNVNPVGIFAAMISGFADIHTTTGTAFGLKGNSAESQTNIIDEIRSVMGFANIKETPRSILEMIDFMAQWHIQVGRNGAAYGNQNKAAYEREATTWETIGLIVREIANQAEQQAIEQKIMMDEFMKNVPPEYRNPPDEDQEEG